MGTALIANACAYLGMIISLAGIKAKRDTQKWCFFIGPLLLMAGAYLFGNTVFILLQAVIVLAGLGGILNAPPKFSWLIVLAGGASLAFLWHGGFVRPNLELTGPIGLVLVALGVALAPRPMSNHLLFWAGVPLFIFSVITRAWPFAVLNFLWGAVLLHTLYFKKRPRS